MLEDERRTTSFGQANPIAVSALSSTEVTDVTVVTDLHDKIASTAAWQVAPTPVWDKARERSAVAIAFERFNPLQMITALFDPARERTPWRTLCLRCAYPHIFNVPACQKDHQCQ
jgi:hypothetical protein